MGEAVMWRFAILPLLIVFAFAIYAASRQMVDCPQGQIFIPRGVGGACVVGSWR